MAKATEYGADPYVRILYAGASGTGKTGSLISLLRAGYKLRLLDLDNGALPLIKLCEAEDVKLLDNLDIMSFRDQVRMSQAGPEVIGQPKAFVNALKALNQWDDGTKPAEWGEEYVLVADSITAFGRAAFWWAKGMNPTSKDPRQWYGAAQDCIKTLMEMLTSKDFHAHVVCISHVQLIEMPDSTMREYVTSIGKALGPELPKYFNNLVLAERSGTGANVKRVIRTAPTTTMDLKLATPAGPSVTMDLNTGMAELFKKLIPAIKKPAAA